MSSSKMRHRASDRRPCTQVKATLIVALLAFTVVSVSVVIGAQAQEFADQQGAVVARAEQTPLAFQARQNNNGQQNNGQQNNGQQNNNGQQPNNGNNGQQNNGQNGGQQKPNSTSSSAAPTTAPSSTGVTSGAPSTSMTSGNMTSKPANMTSVSTSTPSTFPTAVVPSTGDLAGTAQVPFPGPSGGIGQGGKGPLGPSDSFVAGALRLAPPLTSSSWLSFIATALVGLIVAGAAFL